MTSDSANRFGSLGREEREALVSAYALGELEGAEREFVERLLADPAADDARRIVAESRGLADALRAARAEDLPPRSADLRRAVVAALAPTPDTATPAAARPTRSMRSAWLALAGALAATVLVAVTFVGPERNSRDVARRAVEARPAQAAAEQQQAGARALDAPVDAQRADLDAGPVAVELEEFAAAAAPKPAEPETRARPAAPRKAESRDGAAGEFATAVPAPTAAAGTSSTDLRDSLDEMVMEEAEPSLSVDVGAVAGLARQVGPSARPASGGGAAGAPAASNGVFRFDAAAEGAEARDGRAEKRQGEALRRGDEARRADRERYARFEEHRFLAVADRPLSTLSIDVDTASYAVVRRFLAAGRLPPPDAVRLEEFVNYFRYSYPRPDGDDPFAVALEAADCPWRAGHRLVRIGIAGRDIDRTKRPSGNLVFLIDVSGSMDDPDKLPLVKHALAMLVAELTENDRVSIVTYAGDAGLKLPPTSGDQKRNILDVIEGLSAGGSTHGSAGIELAYAQAQERFIAGGANRVILCTDGDLNVGVTSDAALVNLVQEKARGGTFLTVLGFGQGNLRDEKMEAIADKGNGIYAYVDGVREARKVLVEQLTGSTITIAKDVKIQVEFNPAQVASYRLLGYENRRLADADFRDDTKDAGEIGAGHTVTALYEIVPVGGAAAAGDTPGAGAEPLKYQAQKPRAAEPAPAAGPVSTELLTVKLRFKQPEGDVSVLREFPLAAEGGAFADASADTRFAAAVAAFGMLLRNGEFKGDATFATVATIAAAALGPDEGGYRAEFLDLVRKAETLTAGERR